MALKSNREGLRKELVDYLGNLIIDENLKKNILNSIDSFVKIDLLWTNASPTSSFAAQDISVNYSAYKLIMLVFKRDAASNYLCYTLSTARTQSPSATMFNWNLSTIIFRGFNIVNNVITFYAGVRMTAIGTSVDDNNMLIPYKIYGIK